jgi:hypothetical protein
VVEVVVVLDIDVVVVVVANPEVVVEVMGGAASVVVIVGVVVVVAVVAVVGVLEVVLDVVLEVVVVSGTQLSESVTCVRSSVLTGTKFPLTSEFNRSCWLVVPLGTVTPW